MTYRESWISLSFKLFVAFALAHVYTTALAQNDSLSTEPVSVTIEDGQLSGKAVKARNVESEKLHSPKKATLLSTFIPGAGQIYNKKYWKLPIIYGGFAVAGYYLHDNLQNINEIRDDIIAATDDDPNTINDSGRSVSDLEDILSTYKTWRDWSYIAIGAIYILNIIDASVDAHLFYFDVSDDISMNITPFFDPLVSRSTGITLSLKL
jgi:hypothetical protein